MMFLSSKMQWVNGVIQRWHEAHGLQVVSYSQVKCLLAYETEVTVKAIHEACQDVYDYERGILT